MANSTDKTAPKLLSTTPKTGAIKVKANQNLTLTFDEKIKVDSGNVVISDGKDTRTIDVTDKSQVKIIGSKLIINPTENLNAGSSYNVKITSSAIQDVTGNKFTGINSKSVFTFDVLDKQCPVLTSVTPKTSSENIKLTQNLALTFDENVKTGSGYVVIRCDSGSDVRRINIRDSEQVTISGKKLIINPSDDLLSNRHYSVTISPLAVKDLAGNKFTKLNNKTPLTFSTQDKQAPSLQSVGLENKSDVTDSQKKILLTFDEAIKAGFGQIIISNGTDIRKISITDRMQVSIEDNVITLTLKKPLQDDSHYSVYFSKKGVVKDLTNNATDVISEDDARHLHIGDIFAEKNDATQEHTEEHIHTETTSEESTVTKPVTEHDHSHTENSNTLTGKVIDGYVKEATVFADANGDGVQNENEVSTTTNASGDFELTGATGAIIASGGIDISTGETFKGVLKAPAGSSVITPLTTLQQGFVDAGHTPAQAQELLAKAFGFDSTKVDLQTYDPIAELLKTETTTDGETNVDNSFAVQMMASTMQVVNFLVTASQVLQGAAGGSENLSSQVATTALVQTLVSTMQNSETGTIDFTDAAVLQTVLVDSAKEAAKTTTGDASNFTEKMNVMAQSVATVLKESATTITEVVSKGGNATTVLTEMAKVSSFAQNDAGKVLSETAQKIDPKDEAQISALATQMTSLTGDSAKAQIANKAVEVQKVPVVEEHNHETMPPTTDGTQPPAEEHNHDTTPPATGGTQPPAEEHNHNTPSSATGGTLPPAEEHNHDIPSSATGGTQLPAEEHNHDANPPATDETQSPSTEHNHQTTPPTTGETQPPAEEHNHDTGSGDTGSSSSSSEEHNHDTDSGNSGSGSSGSSSSSEEHNHSETTAITVSIAELSHSSASIPNTTASMDLSGGHSHTGSTTTEPAPVSEIPQASFTVMLDHPAPTGGLTVKYQLDGSGKVNSDYTLSAGTNVSALTAKTFKIAEGQTSATINVNVNYNVISEPETVQLHLLSGTGYLAGQNGVSTLMFDDSDSYATGTNSSAVAVGDFNGDGKLDLVVANPNANNVSVLLRNASNTGFSTKVDVETGSTPVAISTGDFNGDGKTDFATANLNGTVSVLLRNAGNSGFDKTDISIGSMANAISTADLNGDGKTDLVVTNGAVNTVSILLRNTANSGFDKTDLTTALAPEAVSVGDFNNDGKLDIVTAGDSKMSVFLQNADGSFATKTDYQTSRGVSSVTVGDFDGDGKLDIATANMQSNTVSVFVNNGNGFAAKTDFKVGAKPTSVKAADLNGDGKIDLAVLSQAGNVVSVLLRNADNTGFVEKIDYVTDANNVRTNFDAYPNALTVGDFNGDGKNDIAVANQNSSSVSVLENASDAILMIAPIQVSVMPTANVMEGDTGNFMIMLDAPAPAGGLKVNFTVNGSATMPADYSLALGTDTTLNHDGSFTIAAGKMSAMLNVVTVNDMELVDDHETINLNLTAGTGYQIADRALFTDRIERATTVVPWVVSAGDFNGDGGDDLIVANEESGVLSVFLQNDRIDFAESTSAVTTGDFNKDGYADFAFVNSANNSVSVVLRKTDNSDFENKTVYQTGLNPSEIQSGDFNSDGYADLVTGNGNGRVSVLLWNAQTNAFSAKSDYVVGTSGSISAIQVADFNGDSKKVIM